MDVNKLVRMANQIAANFDFGPDKAKAAEGVLDHLRRFWTSQMKAQIVERYESGDAGLNEIAAMAVQKLAEDKSHAA
jgi:formate dehydrogenase subunit delta